MGSLGNGPWPLPLHLHTNNMQPGITNKMLVYGDDTFSYADTPFLAAWQTLADNLTVDLMIIKS